MKITVIGHWGGFPAANGATSGYLFQSKGFSLLVDCGSAVLSKLQNYLPVDQLDAVILSHYHHDHIADIGPLQYARMISFHMGKTNGVLPIYGHPYDEEQVVKLTHPDHTEGRTYYPDKSVTIGPFVIDFLKTVHPVDCYAMRISDGEHTVVYTADSSFIEEFISFSENADLLISECNFYADQDGTNAGHMNSLDVGKLANSANVKHLLLTHLPHFGDLSELKKQAKTVYNGPVDLAETGYAWGK
jgi:ribonuclease BN (tRNA processing enzyme)